MGHLKLLIVLISSFKIFISVRKVIQKSGTQLSRFSSFSGSRNKIKVVNPGAGHFIPILITYKQ